MLPGIIEILTIAAILGVFNVLNTILGICFVIRNEIDVPVFKEEREYKSVYQRASSSSSSTFSAAYKGTKGSESPIKASKGKKSKKGNMNETLNQLKFNLSTLNEPDGFQKKNLLPDGFQKKN